MKVTAISILFALSSAQIVAADAKAGQASYDKACKLCHGAAGVANPVIAKLLKADMKDLGSAEAQSKSDYEIKKTIIEGRGKMKPIQPPPSVLDDIVAYVRTFKK